MNCSKQVLAVVFSFCLAICTSTAFADLPEADVAPGIYSYDGDPNFIVWDCGSHVKSVADVSSAYIMSEGEDYEDFAFLSFSVWWNSSDGAMTVEPQHTIVFRYKKDTGEYYMPSSKFGSAVDQRNVGKLEYLRAAAHEHSD
ncbi:hypothetical protein [uncultured Selenomonas sp.]|jgi:hypothetical protein|uniref:hypothetical protein n=1 Tax=uncultured Selenomonas sp. TaxID=159275 RepID=UPI00262B2527|nr:hypothetical protein [uncultured Selenomonas sp.]